LPKIVQYHSSIVDGDAIGYSIRHLHARLLSDGLQSFLCCSDQQVPRPAGLMPVSRILNSAVKNALDPEDTLLIHFSFPDENALKLAQLPTRRIIVYHNITPGRFFLKVGLEGLANMCDHGRGQLAQMSSLFDAAVGDSDYNCEELERTGYRDVSTIPVFVNTDSFRMGDIDAALLNQIRTDAEVNIAFVGRFVPNKAIDKLILAASEFVKCFPMTLNLHLIGKVWDDKYFASLVSFAGELGVARFLRFHLNSDPQRLRTVIAAADAFVCTSKHEGFMVPIVEAFAAGCPVIAVDAAAVPETMGGAGLLLEEADPKTIAGLLFLIKTRPRVKASLIREQARRAGAFDAHRTYELWADKLRLGARDRSAAQ
jgi:glycosyltransferase involved in cell wall biosynthesis